METLTLVLCLAVGITAVPIPEPQILALPAAQPVILLSRPAALRTNAVDSYVVIDEQKGNSPETEIYSSTPTDSSMYVDNDEIGKPSEAESSTVYSQAPTNELPLQINNDKEKEKDSELEVNTVSSPSSTQLSLPDDSSQEFAEPTKPPQRIEPADELVPSEPEAGPPAADEFKPQGGKPEASSSSSSSGGIFSWLNPFHLTAPSIPTLSHIPFFSNLPSLPSLPSVPSLQSVNIANLPSLSSLPSLPIKWPSWLPRPGGSSPSKYIAFRSPVYVYYS